MDKKLLKKLTAEPDKKHKVSEFATAPLNDIDKEKIKRSIAR
jgi:hypothetical protein